MHLIQMRSAAPGLQTYVRFYAHRMARLSPEITMLHPVTARAFPMIVFEFDSAHTVRQCNSQQTSSSYRTTLVGLQTHRRVQLELSGACESFSIGLQPSAIYSWFGVPMDELTDHDYEARSVLGAAWSEFERQLGDCRTFAARVVVADEFLLRQSLNAKPMDGVSAAANRALLHSGRAPLNQLSHWAALSERQFERRFARQVGLRPKLFSRIARFEAALDCRLRGPNKSWLRIAHEFGYHDQMHLIHDFREFSGDAPRGLQAHAELLLQGQLELTRSKLRVRGEPPSSPLLI